MPLARYFLLVGGVLLALLFVIDAYAPQQSAVASNGAHATDAQSPDKTIVRIRSDQKWPERVVYDTSLPTIVPPIATVQAAAPAPSADLSAQARVRDTFAQFVPSEPGSSQPQAAPKKRKVVKDPSKTRSINPPVRVAEQSKFGFFGMAGNSTW